MTEATIAGAINPAAPSQGYWRRVIRRFLKRRLAVVGAVFLVLLGLAVTFGPMVSPYSYDYQDFELLGMPGPMSAEH